MLVIGIILIICAIMSYALPFVIDDCSDVLAYFLFIIALILFVIGICILIDKEPTENDIFEGKAVYQETIHITNNDTIKTYKIVWKEK